MSGHRPTGSRRSQERRVQGTIRSSSGHAYTPDLRVWALLLPKQFHIRNNHIGLLMMDLSGENRVITKAVVEKAQSTRSSSAKMADAIALMKSIRVHLYEDAPPRMVQIFFEVASQSEISFKEIEQRLGVAQS